VTTDLVHLLCGHPDPARHSLIYVGNDVRVGSLAASVSTDQSPKYCPFVDARGIEPFLKPFHRFM
jgi:hypothetical protein